MSGNMDYAYQLPDQPMLEFDMVFVPWPVGPSGNADANAGKVTAATGYMIPVGTEDPELVCNVLSDILNWYGYDANNPDSDDEALDLRDNEEALGWWYGVTAKDVDLQEWNFEVMYGLGLRPQFEMAKNLGVYFDLNGLINGNLTVAQFQETYKLEVQDAIDRLIGE